MIAIRRGLSRNEAMVINVRRDEIEIPVKWKLIGDGKIIRDAFYADGRRRIAGFYVRDKSGRYVVDYKKGVLAQRFVKYRRLRFVKK